MDQRPESKSHGCCKRSSTYSGIILLSQDDNSSFIYGLGPRNSRADDEAAAGSQKRGDADDPWVCRNCSHWRRWSLKPCFRKCESLSAKLTELRAGIKPSIDGPQAVKPSFLCSFNTNLKYLMLEICRHLGGSSAGWRESPLSKSSTQFFF